MKSNVLFAAVDVDDNSYHLCIFNPISEESVVFKTDPSPDHLIRLLQRKNLAKEHLKICYEACHLGFFIQRKLTKAGYNCEVIAPSLTPVSPGRSQKTDRIDCEKLAKYYAMNLLTPVRIPDTEDESTRDLLRSRRFAVQQQTMIRNHITSFCKRYDLNYQRDTGRKSRWTKSFHEWLDAQSNKLEHSAAKVNLRILIKQHQEITTNLEIFDSEIEHIAQSDRYREPVKALCCFKGICEFNALVFASELGDIKRFDHPRRLTSYAGFDIVEYSSGGKEKKLHISKKGNAHVRRAAVDACTFTMKSIAVGRKLRERREGAKKEYIEISDRCTTRLYKKGQRLLHAGKNKNKVRVACARELLGFIWEALKAAA
jgi:transposase